ncbi:MDR family MFS transporter [Dyella flava]|uniref:Multidrug efflux MFS transporter n=1 Tax=Dyella flava TaxID=1920170 RepID=A0ABS2JYT2_9GAMM|nr:MDR family MFS transporter [Dyella flava]MBM7124036.1 multidrug efflux MFS transporter [Dyella flava]GLQ52359.1 MFS transporter [Dyella flava]
MNAALDPAAEATSRRLLVMAALLATFMQAMNISIPNAALLYIQGSLSMADDEIGWVFTAYIAAATIVMPMTAWLAGKFGRKTVFQVSISIFILALFLDTLATTPLQFVAARILQGAASGTLAPISMAILLEVTPPQRQPRMGLVWTVASLSGMLSGPSIGGWLSEFISWQSIFYFSVPLATFVALTMGLYLTEKKAEKTPSFDFFGLAAFTMGIAGLQMLFDRGERMDWFDSREIWVDAIASALGFYLFIVHMLTKDQHFLDKALFKDRNFVVSTLMYFAIGFILLPTLALTSPMLEELLGYPAHTTGNITIPRGMALVCGLLLTARPSPRIDNRLFLLGGLSLVIYGTWKMVRYSPLMYWDAVVWAGIVQGFGLGIVMAALSRTAFSTLDPKLRPEGNAFFNMARLYGSTLGIAIVQIFFFNNTQSMHLALAKDLRPYVLGSSVFSVQGLASLNDEVTGQAAIVGIFDQFKILLVTALVASPLVLFLRKPRAGN